MTNHFISGVRSRREYSDLDQMPEVGIPAKQCDWTEMRELNVAFQRLPREQQEALRMIGIEEQSYEEAAGATGCAVGTVKSRVHRARLNLRSLIHGERAAA
jgi:RNA polymerase sigma-70 factor (ECF subfamily)